MHLASLWRPRAADPLLTSQISEPSAPGAPVRNSGEHEHNLLPPTNLPAKSVYSHAPGLTSSVQSREVLQDITERQPHERIEASTIEKTGFVGGSRIRAAAVQMIFASRTSGEFISPDAVKELEAWSGKAALDALVGFDIPENVSASMISLDLRLFTLFELRFAPARARGKGKRLGEDVNVNTRVIS